MQLPDRVTVFLENVQHFIVSELFSIKMTPPFPSLEKPSKREEIIEILNVMITFRQNMMYHFLIKHGLNGLNDCSHFPF